MQALGAGGGDRERSECYNRLVPKVGLEPTLPKERDFESRASASSATSAGVGSIAKRMGRVKAQAACEAGRGRSA